VVVVAQGWVVLVSVVVVAQGSVVEVSVEVDAVVSGVVGSVLSGLVVGGASCPHAAAVTLSPIVSRLRPSKGASRSAR
jgi:hypothetical protein